MSGRLVPAPESRTQPLPIGKGLPPYSADGGPAVVIATAKKSGKGK